MPELAQTFENETSSNVAARLLGDPMLFRAIADLNPELALFAQEYAAEGGNLEGASRSVLVPLADELSARISPALTSVRTGVETALRIGEQATGQIERYAQIADSLGLSELSASVNVAIGEVRNGLELTQSAVQEYGDVSGIQLVDWLLGKQS